jgi:hypothetical protein
VDIGRKKTHEKYLIDVKKLVGNEYEALRIYNGYKSKIEMIHNKCNYQYLVRPNDSIISNYSKSGIGILII